MTIDILIDPEWDVQLMIKNVVGNCEPTLTVFYDGFNPNDPDSENQLSEESDTTTDEDEDNDHNAGYVTV